MSNIQELFQQAQLAEAAYANFGAIGGGIITDKNGIISALQVEDFSESQATAFANAWEVIDHAPNTAFGFSRSKVPESNSFLKKHARIDLN